MNFDGIIFDLDGTLWDANNVAAESWNKAFSEFKEVNKRVTISEVRGLMGMTLEQIAEKLFPEIDEELRMKIMKRSCDIEYEELRHRGGNLYENLEETLDKLSKKSELFVVSNCHVGYIETFLKFHKLKKYFKDFECSGNTKLSKGENIKLIVERNNLKKPVYVGDTQIDCDAAKFAGVPFIFASYGFGKVDSYDYIIKKVGDITKL